MNTKNRLIENLLRAAKRHKILTYPVLALVALISIFSYFFNWSTGAGKRVVAVVMVMVMLVSQSYFLTSSAENGEDTTEDVTTQEELQAQNEKDTLIDDTAVNTPVAEVPSEKEEPRVEEPSIEEPETSNNPDAAIPGETVVDTDTIGDSQNDSDNGTNGDADLAGAEEDVVDPAAIKCVFILNLGNSKPTLYDKELAIENSDGTYDISSIINGSGLKDALNDSQYLATGYYTVDGWYMDEYFSDKVADPTHVKKNRDGQISLFAKRILKKYKVKIEPTESTSSEVKYEVELGNGVSKVDGVEHTYDVDVQNGVGNLKIKNIYRTGYDFQGAIVKPNGTATKSDGDGGAILDVVLRGDEYAQTVAFSWESGKYCIVYARSDEETDLPPYKPEVHYEGGDEKWADPKTAGIVQKDGYEFDYWKIDGKGEGFKAGETIPGDLRKDLYDSWMGTGDPIVVVPHYRYVGIVSEDPRLTYQYKLPNTTGTLVTAHYKDTDKTGKFTYTIDTVTGENGVNSKETLESIYGIVVDATPNGISVKTIDDGPQKTSINGTLQVTYKVTDANAKYGETDDPDPFTITIFINQRSVGIPETTFVKTYDGNNKCAINGDLESDIEGIKVRCTKAYYDSENAGKRQVTLEGAELVFDSSMQSVRENYTIDSKLAGECVVDGEILPREVSVTTSAENIYSDLRDHIRAGETLNPKLLIEEKEESNKSSIKGLLEDEKDLINDVTAVVKVNLYGESGRDDTTMLADGTRTKRYIIAIEEPEDSNYDFILDEPDIGFFDVVLEDPELGEHYWITGNLTPDGWYGAAEARQIKPLIIGGYNKIRTKNGTWEDVITLTEENTADGTITFQLWDDPAEGGTGAFSAWATIDIDVDLTAPQYIDFEIEAGGSGNPGDGLYFPSEGESVSFGNYFNKTVRFVIRYKDTRSNPKTLYYTLTNTLGSGEEQTAFFGPADEHGYATASFEILATATDKIGNIVFYADDKAGNKETPSNILERHGTEWAVEKNGPEVSALVVKSGEITVHSGDGQYYSNCKAYVTATDVTSGIYGITWHVNGVDYEDRVEDTEHKVRDASFELSINDTDFPTAKGKGQGVYSVYATVTDNAGNTTDTQNVVDFMVDDVEPVVVITRDYDKYAQEILLKFYAYDELSGIKYINIKDANGNMVHHEVERVEENDEGYMTSYCYVSISKKGEYTIIVEDNAGNKYEETITLGKVSSDTPECPKVSFVPEPNDNGWITAENAEIYITNKTVTPEDQMDVKTFYKCWEDGTMEPMLPYETPGNTEIRLPEGIYNLHVWSQSLTGRQCVDADDHVYKLQVDGTAPAVEYQLQKGSGTSLLVSFTVTDAVSGVDRDSIRVMHGAESVLISLSELETGNGYIGSFEITEAGSYTIQAADIAGNEIKTEAFSPMSMKITAVKNLTETSATVGAWVIKGTYDIRTASIAYRKYTDTVYTETDAMPLLDTATGNMSISAVLAGLEPGTEYVYKITAVSEGNEVLEYEGYLRTLSPEDVGIAITGTTRYADNRDGRITVGLLRGNYCIRAVVVDTEQGNSFTFINVPDGSYNLTATDGIFSKTVRVVIKNGRILYPETDFIELVLSGMSTSVEVQTEETPDISADFEFGANDDLMDGDNKLIDAGCTVEYKLTARLIRVTSVDTAALAAMYAVAGNNKIVGAYLDLTLYKYVTDEDGVVTRTRVSSLDAKGAQVSVTIPLGDMAGKPGLMVVRIHQNGDTYTGRYLPDQDNNLSTYTVITNQFSTYAVLYDGERSDDPTIDRFNPQYPGEDEDITGGGNSTSIKANTASEERAIEEPDVKRSSVGTLTSSGSAKTGDEAPIAAAGIMMMIAVGGLFVLRRKTK